MHTCHFPCYVTPNNIAQFVSYSCELSFIYTSTTATTYDITESVFIHYRVSQPLDSNSLNISITELLILLLMNSAITSPFKLQNLIYILEKINNGVIALTNWALNADRIAKCIFKNPVTNVFAPTEYKCRLFRNEILLIRLCVRKRNSGYKERNCNATRLVLCD